MPFDRPSSCSLLFSYFSHDAAVTQLISSLLRLLIPTSLEKNEKVKRFWSFVKSFKNNAFGINGLWENGILKTDTHNKAKSVIDNFSQLSHAI